MQIISYQAAKAQGLKRYFTGKKCKNGHIAERMVSHCGCIECAYLRTHIWCKDKANRALKNSMSRAWHEKNPEYAAQWVKKNPDARRRIARKWYMNNSERAVQIALNWGKRNIEKRRTNIRNYFALKRKAKGKHTAEQILELLRLQQWQCVGHHCAASLRHKRHIDHIMPLILGGSNYIWNLQGLCPTCNCSKNGKHPIAWAAEYGIFY